MKADLKFLANTDEPLVYIPSKGGDMNAGGIRRVKKTQLLYFFLKMGSNNTRFNFRNEVLFINFEDMIQAFH